MYLKIDLQLSDALGYKYQHANNVVSKEELQTAIRILLASEDPDARCVVRALQLDEGSCRLCRRKTGGAFCNCFDS